MPRDDLIYTLDLAPVQGWVWGSQVNVTADGVPLGMLADGSCKLIDAVASLVPPAAAATRSGACSCYKDR